MKKLLTLTTLVFTLMFSSTSFAEWTKVGVGMDGDSYYVDFERIRKVDEYVYYWQLADLNEPIKTKSGSRIYSAKKRMKVDAISKELSKKHRKYIEKIIGKPLQVSAKQWINFSRLTFVHKTQKERLTIDINLSFENEKESGDLRDLVIAEVKQERISRKSDFMRIAKEMSIFPMRLSKYCISTMQLWQNIKQNRFKKKQLFINKLKQA